MAFREFSQGTAVETPRHLQKTFDWESCFGTGFVIIVALIGCFLLYKIGRLVSKSYKKVDRYLDK